jgi:hypothetical protein
VAKSQSAYAPAMPYADLTEGEQAHFDEYTNLRQISDWPGFTAAQDARKRATRGWLLDQRQRIEDAAKKEADGWKKAKRKERYAYLEPANLNRGAPKHEVRLPCPSSATDLEAVHIEEREVYLTFATTTDAQKARKQANVDWLVNRRKQLYALQKEDPKKAGRRSRYEALCVATHYGTPYERWDKEHNKWGAPLTAKPAKNFRDQIVDRCRSALGTSEKPAGSNRGHKQPSEWENRVYGGDGVPWCACFAVCTAWDVGIKGAGTASVQLNVNLARQGRGIYRGWTTDPSRVRPGDHCAIGGTSSHTGVVVGPTAYDTIEGNTSPGSEGSQYNGGTTARRNRKGQIVGWMLIRDP